MPECRVRMRRACARTCFLPMVGVSWRRLTPQGRTQERCQPPTFAGPYTVRVSRRFLRLLSVTRSKLLTLRVSRRVCPRPPSTRASRRDSCGGSVPSSLSRRVWMRRDARDPRPPLDAVAGAVCGCMQGLSRRRRRSWRRTTKKRQVAQREREKSMARDVTWLSVELGWATPPPQ